MLLDSGFIVVRFVEHARGGVVPRLPRISACHGRFPGSLLTPVASPETSAGDQSIAIVSFVVIIPTIVVYADTLRLNPGSFIATVVTVVTSLLDVLAL